MMRHPLFAPPWRLRLLIAVVFALALPLLLVLSAAQADAAAPAAAPAQAHPMPPGFGPDPTLPAPAKTILPAVNIAPAIGWPSNTRPTPAPGLAVAAYAGSLEHPRWLYVLPNGDVLVAETNGPDRPDNSKGVKGAIMQHEMKRAGAAAKSANRITLLRGLGPDGLAQQRTVFLDGLQSPFGMALVGKQLYVANTDAVLRFPYEPGQTRITTPGTKVMDLPAGAINHHWTKNIVASPDGRKLYVSVGSNSNVGERGMDQEDGRAAIWELDIASGKAHVFATGLRNPVGMAFPPGSGVLWTSVNERDELGDDLVPDFMTSVKAGHSYGWPYSYYGQHPDPRIKPQQESIIASATKPDYALGAHTASLGLAFYDGKLLARYQNGALVGQHGSWNRREPAGYKLIFVPFSNGMPSGPPQDVLTGFLSSEGKAYGRPVGVAVDKAGAILLADDVGNVIWRVTGQ
jgi:glucose/arabinose dehydrogenase